VTSSPLLACDEAATQDMVRGRYRFRLLVKSPRGFDLSAYLWEWLAVAPKPKGNTSSRSMSIRRAFCRSIDLPDWADLPVAMLKIVESGILN
jgi:hypothetical protein